MREWKLKPTDPLCLVLAWDARLGGGEFTDDHIWELAISRGDPSSLALQTTYGLRARSMRIFPRFVEGELSLIDPAGFAVPPVITKILPNLIQLKFAPFPGIDVIADLWVPQPHALAARYQITNRDSHPRSLRVELIGQLSPTEGARLAPVEVEHTRVMAGQTAGLAPLLFIVGGAASGPGSYPTLVREYELRTGQPARFDWIQTAGTSLQASLDLARRIAGMNWEAEWSYLELLNASQVEVFTGEPDWDAAFMLAQVQARLSLQPASASLPHPSYVVSRLPDQGFSLRGDGSDYNHLWNGQSPLETLYLAGLLLPGETELIEGLLRNFLSVQAENGFVDWRPGLAGQRSEVLATPVLANLGWRIYQSNQDQGFLEQVFPGLARFVDIWFTPEHDRDQDGWPEWDHPMQSNSEDHPAYSRWHAWSLGVDITTAENPGLLAMLYRECLSLVQMAEQLGDAPAASRYEQLAGRLKHALGSAWDAEQALYLDLDRQTHFSSEGRLLGERSGSGQLIIGRKFRRPVRLLIQIQASDLPGSAATLRRPRLEVSGQDAAGLPVTVILPDSGFRWHLGRGLLTSEGVFKAVDDVNIENLSPGDTIQVFTAGYRSVNHTALLPLWAGIPEPKQAEKMVNQSITSAAKFWRSFGLPGCLEAPPEAATCQGVDLIWNTLIGEGLVRYGYRQQAGELVSRLMRAVIQNLKANNTFRRYYHADSGEGVGEPGALGGLAPLELFLETLGVRLLNPRRVIISGFNPYPWPVTVKYRGLTILRLQNLTNIIFPDGQAITIDDPAPQVVSLEIAPL